MKKILLAAAMIASNALAAESLLQPVNDLGAGTWAVRLQALSMYRDFENNTPGHAYATTLGLQLGYESPEWQGLRLGAVYSYVEPVDAGDTSDNGRTLLSNGRVNLLNEAWLKYRMEACGLADTWLKAGRQVVAGEVFRADEFRQKPRSLEAVALTTKDIPHTALTAGHAWKLSNWMDNKNDWRFNDFGEDVFKTGYSTDGISWGETVFTGIAHLELAVFEAYAYDVANLAGGRAKYTVQEGTALNGLYRYENDVGRGVDHEATLFGASVEQKLGGVTLEPGVFIVQGDNLLFQETTVGINHPLGSSMMIYPGMFNGDSDTAYLKGATTLGKTSLYLLYSYTWQDHDLTPYDGQELDAVVKQMFGAHLAVALKVGVGYRDRKDGADDTFASDTRLFVTYTF